MMTFWQIMIIASIAVNLSLCVQRTMPTTEEWPSGASSSPSPSPRISPSPSTRPGQTGVPVPPDPSVNPSPPVEPTPGPSATPTPLPQITGSQFLCKQSGGGYRPYWKQLLSDGKTYKDWSQTSKGLLGQNAMPNLGECQQALAAANHVYGVICSRTGLNGWKPTLYTGTSPGRADYGYLGGSSIERFADCLKATQNSSSKGVCFWGGSTWYASYINREGVAMGSFSTLDQCVARTK